MDNDEFRAIMSRAIAPEDEALSMEEINKRAYRIGKELKLLLPDPPRTDLVPATRLRARDGRLFLEAGFTAASQRCLVFDPDYDGDIAQVLDDAARRAPDALVDREAKILRRIAGDENAQLTPRDVHYLRSFGGGLIDLPLINESQSHLLPDRPSPSRGREERYLAFPSAVTKNSIKLRAVVEMPRESVAIPVIESRRSGVALILKVVSDDLRCAVRLAATDAINAGREHPIRFMAIPIRDQLTGRLLNLELRSLLE